MLSFTALLALGVALPASAQEDSDPDDPIDEYLPLKWTESITAAIADTGAKFLRPTSTPNSVDLTRLTAKRNLKGLRLSSATLPSLAFLQNLPELEVLELSNCAIADLSELRHLKKLRILVLSFNPIFDLGPLAELTHLQVLMLERCQVTDLAPLRNLAALRHLDLTDNPIESIAPLTNLINLTNLSLYKAKRITDFSPLRQLTLLADLNLSFCSGEAIVLQDLSPLTHLRNLRLQGGVLEVPGLIDRIAQLRSLERLTLGMNPSLADLAPLEGLSNLLYLDVHGCSIADLRPLAKLTSLRKLILNNNQVRDLSPLTACRRLLYLAAFGNPLSSADPVLTLPSLRQLYLPKEYFTPAQQKLVLSKAPRQCRVRFL